MINRIIDLSLTYRKIVLGGAIFLFLWGLYMAVKTPVDAIPDLSEVQVIVRTTYPGRSPQVIEEQITYPLTTTLMAVPGAKTVRGYSSFGDSFIYVIFESGTDLYWARSRVLEYLNQGIGRLPQGVQPEIGPDATGVGWIYQYALVDRTGKRDISELRTLQDWFLKFELRTVPGVAEVATVGGLAKEYQIILNPDAVRALELSLDEMIEKVKGANVVGGGSVLELAESEYILRSDGFLRSVKDVEQIPVGLTKEGTPILLRDIARVRTGPQKRRGIAELNGEGEVVGGIIVMRSGKNALQTIEAVKAKLKSLKSSLPQGVEMVPVYDRSKVIKRSIQNLFEKLFEESIAVVLICLIFLLHLRSAFIVLLTLPLGILAAFIMMSLQGVTANLMSLGGIAIAIGAMVDAAIVMIENTHKHLERWRKENPHKKQTFQEYLELIRGSATQVGSALFFSLLIITISFLPVFALQEQEGLLFSPLAYTKTYAMAAAAGLSITLVPALSVYFVRGKILSEEQNVLNRALTHLYRKSIEPVLKYPGTTLGIALILMGLSYYPLSRIGSEFMPPLEEGDLLYMPSTFPSVSVGKAAQILQQTDRLIAGVPEVKTVFGKMGRAETATDPAPLEMLETVVQLKDPSEWRPGMTLDKLIAELDRTVRLPGLTNLWVQPIRNRIEMLSTGMKGGLGLKITGPDLKTIESLAKQVEGLVRDLPGTGSVFAERLRGGRYIDISIKRSEAARYGLNVKDVQEVINTVIGGETITESVEGIERYPIHLRYPLDWRDSLRKIRQFPLLTPTKALIPMEVVADIRLIEGPTMLRLEDARPSGWVFVDVRDRDIGSYIKEAQKVIQEHLLIPPRYSLTWTGQFESMERANRRLLLIVPLTLVSISFLLYLIFRRWTEPFLVLLTLPFALVGGFWLIYWLGFNLSVAVNVGFIALAGVAAEFSVILLLYLKMVLNDYERQGKLKTVSDLKAAIIEGAVQRVRPKSMTVSTILAGLFPIMISHGTGSDVMKRIATPLFGGMITAPLLSMLVIPAAYFIWQKRSKRLFP